MMATPWRLFWLMVIAFHAVAAAAWFWLMPGGFPLSHPRFWSGRVIPVLIMGIVASAVSASRHGRVDALRLALAVFPTAWAAASLAGRVAFPITLGRLF